MMLYCFVCCLCTYFQCAPLLFYLLLSISDVSVAQAGEGKVESHTTFGNGSPQVFVTCRAHFL